MTHYGYSTPEEAEHAFYQAFQDSDLPSMMKVWANREFIECIHPMGDRIQGPQAIADSWRQIFEGGLSVELQLSHIHRTQDALLAVHIVYEHLSVPGQNVDYPPVIATNIYQLLDGGWHMVLHHASPSPHEEHDDSIQKVSREPSGHRLH